MDIPTYSIAARDRRWSIAREQMAAVGMTFAFEPSCVMGGRMVNLGGTAVVGDPEPIELNAMTGHLLRV